MPVYHAVLRCELGYEFGAEVNAKSRAAARVKLHVAYPESRIVQVESPREVAFRRYRVERFHQRAYDSGEQY